MTAPQLSLMDTFVPPSPGDEMFDELVRIAWELSGRIDIVGVTVGEAVFEYEKRNRRQVGGMKMSDAKKEQRQTSWLPRIMKCAGLSSTDNTRRSPVIRHHSHRHSVWVRPDAAMPKNIPHSHPVTESTPIAPSVATDSQPAFDWRELMAK